MAEHLSAAYDQKCKLWCCCLYAWEWHLARCPFHAVFLPTANKIVQHTRLAPRLSIGVVLALLCFIFLNDCVQPCLKPETIQPSFQYLFNLIADRLAGRLRRFLTHCAPGVAAKRSSKALGCPIFNSSFVDDKRGNFWPVDKLAPCNLLAMPHKSGGVASSIDRVNHVATLSRFGSFLSKVPNVRRCQAQVNAAVL